MADLDLYTEKSSLVNFADDTQSWVIADSEEECKKITKEEANKVIDFFSANHLVNNADKAALLYNSNGVGITTEIEDIGGENLKSKESEKLLVFHQISLGIYILKNSKVNYTRESAYSA